MSLLGCVLTQCTLPYLYYTTKGCLVTLTGITAYHENSNQLVYKPYFSLVGFIFVFLFLIRSIPPPPPVLIYCPCSTTLLFPYVITDLGSRLHIIFSILHCNFLVIAHNIYIRHCYVYDTQMYSKVHPSEPTTFAVWLYNILHLYICSIHRRYYLTLCSSESKWNVKTESRRYKAEYRRSVILLTESAMRYEKEACVTGSLHTANI